MRYGAKTVDGVVTYETVLLVDNSDLLLRPGMTATAEITVNHIANAVLVPNAALRFSPPEEPACGRAEIRSDGMALSPPSPGCGQTKGRCVKGKETAEYLDSSKRTAGCNFGDHRAIGRVDDRDHLR